MVDVVEFHSKVDDYVKGFVSLDLLNKVINTVDLLYQLDPAQPGEYEAACCNNSCVYEVSPHRDMIVAEMQSCGVLLTKAF